MLNPKQTIPMIKEKSMWGGVDDHKRFVKRKTKQIHVQTHIARLIPNNFLKFQVMHFLTCGINKLELLCYCVNVEVEHLDAVSNCQITFYSIDTHFYASTTDIF